MTGPRIEGALGHEDLGGSGDRTTECISVVVEEEGIVPQLAEDLPPTTPCSIW